MKYFIFHQILEVLRLFFLCIVTFSISIPDILSMSVSYLSLGLFTCLIHFMDHLYLLKHSLLLLLEFGTDFPSCQTVQHLITLSFLLYCRRTGMNTHRKNFDHWKLGTTGKFFPFPTTFVLTCKAHQSIMRPRDYPHQVGGSSICYKYGS